MSDPTKKSYKDTLNLPQTTFAMEAKLVANEPVRLKKWQDAKLYDQLLASPKHTKGKWILHDGPPFANGDIHIGHVINKTLKDVILRSRSMQGYQTPYVPGWDCHGLPIEHKIQEQLKKEGKNFREVGVVEARKLCYAYADKYVKVQSEQFQRLGILGDWANPYLTMVPPYEAATLEVFARFVEAGLVYKQLKPVPWSVANQTALADAELEYEDVTDPSVYVEFPILSESLKSEGRSLKEDSSSSAPLSDFRLQTSDFSSPTHLLVWTTTPWTLPANLAVAVAPKGEYSFVRYERDGQTKVGVIATNLVDLVFKNRQGVTSYEVVGAKLGEELLDLTYRHPFLDRVGKVLPAEYVTVAATEGEEPGTGLVHTAPGHGEEDYETGIKFGLEVYSPVLANGRFDDTTSEFIRGKTTKEGNVLITAKLKELGVLLAEVPIKHSYPHDWRSKTPIIFRATEQWFVAMTKPYSLPEERKEFGFENGGEDLRSRALAAVHEPLPSPADSFLRETAEKRSADEGLQAFVSLSEKWGAHTRGAGISFVPAWGRNRLVGMLHSRPDWCVSRQRAWGLPIPVFYNEQGEALLTPDSVRAVAATFGKKGSNAWFTDSPAELLGDFDPGPKFPKDKLRKESDIFDVWFESGSSWHSCLQQRKDLAFPADLYLEGSDQHRGWFQLSLLPSLGATGRPPFKQILTHGFAVKPDGTKWSKRDQDSNPDYPAALKMINLFGTDVLRLWTCSMQFEGDMPTSISAAKEFGDKYRKIRNSIRYLLSNLYDFNPSTDSREVVAASLDGWVLAELDQLIIDVREAYDKYQLHHAFKLIHEFCVVQLSATYGNAMKDRLYCDAINSPLRRRSQTAMHKLAVALIKLIAPICVFTADEAWEHLQHKPAEDAGLASVHLALFPEPTGDVVSEDQRQEWKLLMDLRSDALGQLDKLTRAIGKYKALDAEIIFHVDDDATRRRLQAYGVDLADMVGCGYHSFSEKPTPGPAVVVEVVDRREKYQACARSWKRRPDVGTDTQFPDLTLRDAEAMRGR